MKIVVYYTDKAPEYTNHEDTNHEEPCKKDASPPRQQRQLHSHETPAPGRVLTRDYRSDATKRSAKSNTSPVKVLTWNIERGYKLEGIIEELKRLDADIIALQEVDIGCERSGYVDCGVAMAKELGLNYVFVTEFEEIHSPVRDAASQGGGVHGNCFLTKYDISNVHVIDHKVRLISGRFHSDEDVFYS